MAGNEIKKEKKPNVFPQPDEIDFREFGQAGVAILVEQALRASHGLGDGLRQHLGVDLGEIMRHRPQVVQALRQIAADPERCSVTDRGGAIALLGELGGTGEIPLLEAILSCEEETLSNRCWAAYAIAKTAGPGAIDILVPYLEHPDPVFRKRTVQALAAAQTEEALPILHRVAESEEVPFVANAAVSAVRESEERLGLPPTDLPYRETDDSGGTAVELE
ncbi:MAG: HEAT repeat domain-containing protein [Candidatus Aminicenantes bacterium]|nr:HEAT repeat domain-containing protein [Candidatus Aminicenantes bacterium]